MCQYHTALKLPTADSFWKQWWQLHFSKKTVFLKFYFSTWYLFLFVLDLQRLPTALSHWNQLFLIYTALQFELCKCPYCFQRSCFPAFNPGLEEGNSCALTKEKDWWRKKPKCPRVKSIIRVIVYVHQFTHTSKRQWVSVTHKNFKIITFCHFK